jgi:Uma2 family endonuclease
MYLELQPVAVVVVLGNDEVLSPSTARLDRTRKLPVYARELVGHLWLVDAAAQTLEVFRLDGATYRLVQTAAGDERVRAEPFDAIELDLAVLWAR